MIFDSSKPFDWDALLVRFHVLYERGKNKRIVVELTEKSNRTISQNSYLHVLLRYFALQYGEKDEKYIKRNFFKYVANRDLFFIEWKKVDFTDVSEMSLRSSSALSVEEMSLAISRFIDWSAQEAGIRLPRPDEKDFIQECEIEVEKHKKFLIFDN